MHEDHKMEPFNTITAALISVKTATDIAKLLKDSDLSLEKAELKLKLADLMDVLSEAKIKIADFKEVIREKDDTIRTLQQSLDIKANLKWESPYYWKFDGNTKDGPFCQHCMDDKEKLIRLQNYGQGR